MIVVFGLGNNEKKYKNSRHNVGHMVIESFKLELSKNEKLGCSFVKQKFGDQDFVFAKSSGFMNNSGEPVQKLLNFFKLKPKNLVVIHDDIDIDFEKIQKRFSGSSAGHNGLKSIIQHLNTQDFYRLRVGIRKINFKSLNQDTNKYVMADFSKDQKENLTQIIDKAREVILQFKPDKEKETYSI